MQTTILRTMIGLNLLCAAVPDACLCNPERGKGTRDVRKSLAYSRVLQILQSRRARKAIGSIGANENPVRQVLSPPIFLDLLPCPSQIIRQALNLLLPDMGVSGKRIKSAVALTNEVFMISYPRVCASQRSKGLARSFGKAHKQNGFSPMGR